MTPAETYSKVKGYVYNRDVMASNFRALFTLTYNQWAKPQQRAEQLWPLSIDHKTTQSTKDLIELYRKPVEDYYSTSKN